MTIEDFLNENEKNQLIDSIKSVEKVTSGELRVHIESICPKVIPVKRAIKVFKKLKMHKTKLKTGVLIYISIEDKKIAVLGDKGIDTKVGKYFWESVADSIKNDLSDGNYVDAILKGIELIKEKLVEHFPISKLLANTNELTDDISYE